ncbi:unnamed protein product [Protopolystoma xenopodis]|uniref:Cyclic nucleotide-binding domain-containing protein n=1 Tax=Protopolystoma xenopodis TaxID=117903 RepID=A0A3S5B8T2_9PLAT|nr:unnamed protein product [Protopolystoma xenopodis]
MPSIVSLGSQGGASEGCLRNVSLRLRAIHLPPGDTLIHAGGLLSTLYYVARGSLEVLDSDGSILAVLNAGDMIGGLAPIVATTTSTAASSAASRCPGNGIGVRQETAAGTVNTGKNDRSATAIAAASELPNVISAYLSTNGCVTRRCCRGDASLHCSAACVGPRDRGVAAKKDDFYAAFSRPEIV